jgi:SAM-dependent methyltransferase
MNSDDEEARRCCQACAAYEAILPAQPVWPVGWRCPVCGHDTEQRSGISVLAPELADTISGFDPESFSTLAEIEAGHFWFVPRYQLIVGLADKFFPDARRLLEIGCGNGAVLRALTSSRRWERAVGTDLHPTGLARARERMPCDVEFVQMNALAIPAVAAFDLVGAFDVVEHVSDDEGVLRAMRRVLKRGGGAIIAVPQHPWLWSRADDIAHHQRRYQRGELESKLQRTGFECLSSTSYTATLLPLLLASRLKARFIPSSGDLDREVAPNPVVNAILKTILTAEVRLALAGIRWPVGGSRVVVARAV